MALSILNEEMVRTLAHVIRYKEADAIYVLNFSTEAERSKYLKDCKWNYDTILALLDSAAQLKTKLQGSGVWGRIADDFLTYLVYYANTALQTVPNYLLRMDYLKKIVEHSDHIMNLLNEQNPAKANDVAEEVLDHKAIMLEYLSNYRSTAPLSFSQWIKSSGISIQQLVQRYQAEVGYQGPFKNLEDEQKIMVYERIIQASGRGSVRRMVNGKFVIEECGLEGWTTKSKPMPKENQSTMSTSAASLKKMCKPAIAGLLFAADNTTWDKSTAKAKISVATRDALKEVAMSRVCGASIIGAFAGFLFDTFVNSRGKPLSTEGLVSYASSALPDGVVLARQIAHQPYNV